MLLPTYYKSHVIEQIKTDHFKSSDLCASLTKFEVTHNSVSTLARTWKAYDDGQCVIVARSI